MNAARRRRHVFAGVAFALTLGASSVCAAEPLTLGAALALARSQAADVRVARAQEDAAGATASAALAGYLPNLSASGLASHTWIRSGSLVGGTEAVERASLSDGSGSAAVRWNPFDFGQTPARVGSARADARAATYRAQATTLAIFRDVATAYLAVVYDDQLVTNAKTTVKIRERHAAIVRGQVTSGVRTMVDEGRARVELEVAQLEQISVDRQAAQDRVRLATLLIVPLTRTLQLSRPTIPNDALPPPRAAEAAVSRRPEVRASANDVTAREDALSAAKLARLPTVTTALEASKRIPFGDRSSLLATADQTSLVASAGVSIPIFDWQVWSQPAVQEGQLAAAEAARDGAIARVRGEAAEASVGVQAARTSVERAKNIQDLAGATLAVLEGRFQSGLASTTDLFDAASRDAEARRGAIRAELDLDVAIVQYLAATGRIGELER